MNIENREKQALSMVIVAMVALAGLTGVFVWIGAQTFPGVVYFVDPATYLNED